MNFAYSALVSRIMVLLILIFLLSVAFFTMLERKILSYTQIRKGPNKLSFMGLLQPVIDGLKLLKKLNLINFKSFLMLYYVTSIMMLLISILLMLSIPFYMWEFKMLVFLWMLLIMGLSSFLMLMIGWGSMSKFGMLGSSRSIAQTLSFEVGLTLMVFMPFILMKIFFFMSFFWSKWFSWVMALLFFILCLLDTQRSPMDLAEGESELVSGYNTEYNSVLFTAIFLSEYMNILLLLIISLFTFMMFNISLYLMLYTLVLLIRSCYPRIRYDKLMALMWLKSFPFIIIFWFMIISIMK